MTNQTKGISAEELVAEAEGLNAQELVEGKLFFPGEAEGKLKFPGEAEDKKLPVKKNFKKKLPKRLKRIGGIKLETLGRNTAREFISTQKQLSSNQQILNSMFGGNVGRRVLIRDGMFGDKIAGTGDPSTRNCFFSGGGATSNLFIPRRRRFL